MKHLINIQQKLVAPKGNRNDFGNFNYRSAEDILAAVKPLLAEEGCLLTLSDELVMFNDRFYIKATATLVTPEQTFSTNGYAREEQAKKGMDASQVTGSTSSYARKYALSGLFAIDGEKDADTNHYTEVQRKAEKAEKTAYKGKTKENLIDEVVALCDANGHRVSDVCAKVNVVELSELTEDRLIKCIEWIKGGCK